jgi:hypothetical protein
MQILAACFGPAVRVIQAVAVNQVQGTNEHAIMLASRLHIKLLFRYGQKSVYCACNWGVIVGMWH